MKINNMESFIITNWGTIIIFIWGIISFLWWIYEFFQKQKQSVEIEKLKTQLELQKNQKLLNDKEFRKAYEIFINSIITVIETKKYNKIKNDMYNFLKIAILYAWPNTIKSFWKYKLSSSDIKEDNKKNILPLIWELFLEMRKDLWVSNEKIDELDILQTFINWNIRDEI